MYQSRLMELKMNQYEQATLLAFIDVFRLIADDM